jgi:hypothetical protein
MAKKQPRVPANLQPWIDARRKFHLSLEHVQMAHELGMNPKKLGKLDNHDQEPWKLPLREFIGKLYFKRFGKGRPDAVKSIEETAAAKQAKKAAATAHPGWLTSVTIQLCDSLCKAAKTRATRADEVIE